MSVEDLSRHQTNDGHIGIQRFPTERPNTEEETDPDNEDTADRQQSSHRSRVRLNGGRDFARHDPPPSSAPAE
jgi:hypothetical protein